MSCTAQSTERKKVTFVNNDNNVDKQTLTAPHSSEILPEQTKLQRTTPLSVLSNNSENNDYNKKNNITSLQPRRNSLQPIKCIDAIASHCVNFDQFLSSIKESKDQTYLNNNCSSNTNGECNANAERVLRVNNISNNNNNQNIKERVNANIGKIVERKYSINSKRQEHQEKIDALEDPYAPEHQGSVYSTMPELTISSQNEESRRSVNSINSNNTINSNYSINKNTRNYTQGSMHKHEYNRNEDNSCNGNDENSNSNSLGSILYSQQPMRGKRLRSENLHREEEEEELLHLSPIPSSARKRHRLQPSCSLENANNEESQERMYARRHGRQSQSQYDQQLLDKYQSNIEKMNTRLHKMERQLAEHLLPVSQEIAESKNKYDELCGKLGTIEQMLSQERKYTLAHSSVNSSQLAEESNSTKSALEEVKTEISKLCQIFTSMQQKVNALSSSSNVHTMNNINVSGTNETSSTVEKPRTPLAVLSLQPAQPREANVIVGNVSSEHKNTNPFNFVKQNNNQKVSTTGNETGVVGTINSYSSHDTTNKSTNFFTFGALTKNDSNTQDNKGNNESASAADGATNTTLAFQQTANPLPTKDNVNDAQDNKNNSTATIFAPRTAETTPSFTTSDNKNNSNNMSMITSVNSSAANPFATSLSTANTTSSPFSFANATSNAATVTDSSNNNNNNNTATTNTTNSISDTSTNANVSVGSTSNDTNNKDDQNSSNTKPANPFTFASSTNNFNFGSSTAANNINAQDSTNVTSPFFATSSLAQNSNPSPTSTNPFAFSSTSRNPFSASTSAKDNEATNMLSNASTIKAGADDKSNSVTNTADLANKTNTPTFGLGFGQVANTKTEKADTSNTPFAATNTFASAFGSKLADSTNNSNTANTTSTSTAAFPFATSSAVPSSTTLLPANNNNNSNSATMTNPFAFSSTNAISSSSAAANNDNNNNRLSTESSAPAFVNTTIGNSNNTNLFSGFGTQSMTTSTSSSSSPFSNIAPANANTNNIFGNATLPSTGVNSFGAVTNSLGNVSNPFTAFGGGSNNNSANMNGCNVGSVNNVNVGGSGVDTHILGTATRKKTTRRY